MTTPDFEQIAREILHHLFDLKGGPSIITARLRDVWNARGAADIATINKLPAQAQAAARGFGHLVRSYDVRQALRGLDR